MLLLPLIPLQVLEILTPLCFQKFSKTDLSNLENKYIPKVTAQPVKELHFSKSAKKILVQNPRHHLSSQICPHAVQSDS